MDDNRPNPNLVVGNAPPHAADQSVEFVDSEGRPYRIFDKPVTKIRDPRDEAIRIEALRAASRVMAGMYAGNFGKTMAGGEVTVTLGIAEQFAKWLEAGER